MTRLQTEFEIQRALCLWLDGYPDRNGVPTKAPALRSGAVYWHTPNGGSRRDAFEGKRLKQIGLKAGIHDLLFLYQGRLYGLEMKALGETARPVQVAMHATMLTAGLAGSAIVDSLDAARAMLRTWALVDNQQ